MRWVRWTDHAAVPAAQVLVEGLPGVGSVGRLVVEHLCKRLDAMLVAELHSPDFPPQALVEEDGTARLMGLRLWAVAPAPPAPGMLILTGDTQPLSSHGQFEITTAVLERARQAGCTTVYTVGGLPGAPPQAPVVAACSDTAMVERVRTAGAECGGAGPEGGIIGASGVFLGLAPLHGAQGACIMGRSTGDATDVPAARAVLEVLGRLLERSIGPEGLEEVAAWLQEQIERSEDVGYYAAPTDVDHHYIG